MECSAASAGLNNHELVTHGGVGTAVRDLFSIKNLCELLELFERRGVALISVAESLDTSSATAETSCSRHDSAEDDD